jgi:hypothetical protein
LNSLLFKRTNVVRFKTGTIGGMGATTGANMGATTLTANGDQSDSIEEAISRAGKERPPYVSYALPSLEDVWSDIMRAINPGG